MEDTKFKVVLFAQLGAAILLFGVIVFWRGEWNAMRWIGLGIGLPALVGLFVARFQLGKSFAVTPQARALVTHGLYSKIRNPMYVFSGLLIVGFALAVQVPYLLLIIAVLLPLQIVRARQEARVLEEKFGDEYREYRKKTWF
jgi:protein-S-isoprenylcysteine O-methyltransferase Ste14